MDANANGNADAVAVAELNSIADANAHTEGNLGALADAATGAGEESDAGKLHQQWKHYQ